MMELIPVEFNYIAGLFPHENGAHIFSDDASVYQWYIIWEGISVGFCLIADASLEYQWVEPQFRRRGYGTFGIERRIDLGAKFVYFPNSITRYIIEDLLNYRLEVEDVAGKIYRIVEEID